MAISVGDLATKLLNNTGMRKSDNPKTAISRAIFFITYFSLAKTYFSLAKLESIARGKVLTNSLHVVYDQEVEENTNTQAPPQNATQTPNATQPVNAPTPQSTKTLVTILLLIFVGPVGFIVMWVWSGWKVWVNLLLTFVGVLLVAVPIVAAVALIAVNPKGQLEKARLLEQIDSSTKLDSNFNPDGDYRQIFADSFMDACTTGGAEEDLCQCVLDGIETQLTDEEFNAALARGTSIMESEDFAKLVQATTTDCVIKYAK